LVEKLGERYELMRTSIKKWTVGAPIQAPLDAIEILRKRRPFEADEVRRVVVRVSTSGFSHVDNKPVPDVCLQHMIAVMLIDKKVSFQSAHDVARMKDAAVLKQRAKVEAFGDDELERRLPQREGILEVTLADGTQLREHIKMVRGTADNPMTRDEVVAKALSLVTPVLGSSNGAKLIERVLNLEQVKDVRELRPLLQRA
jgi:2-methylcitrate dehydratase PrpD